jgi:hypothetical protein
MTPRPRRSGSAEKKPKKKSRESARGAGSKKIEACEEKREAKKSEPRSPSQEENSKIPKFSNF